MGDLNGWVGERVRADITGVFEVLGENSNGKRVVDFCAERGLCIGYTYFKHSSLHKYTRVARGQDFMKAMSMIDLVLEKMEKEKY